MKNELLRFVGALSLVAMSACGDSYYWGGTEDDSMLVPANWRVGAQGGPVASALPTPGTDRPFFETGVAKLTQGQVFSQSQAFVQAQGRLIIDGGTFKLSVCVNPGGDGVIEIREGVFLPNNTYQAGSSAIIQTGGVITNQSFSMSGTAPRYTQCGGTNYALTATIDASSGGMASFVVSNGVARLPKITLGSTSARAQPTTNYCEIRGQKDEVTIGGLVLAQLNSAADQAHSIAVFDQTTNTVTGLTLYNHGHLRLRNHAFVSYAGSGSGYYPNALAIDNGHSEILIDHSVLRSFAASVTMGPSSAAPSYSNCHADIIVTNQGALVSGQTGTPIDWATVGFDNSLYALRFNPHARVSVHDGLLGINGALTLCEGSSLTLDGGEVRCSSLSWTTGSDSSVPAYFYLKDGTFSSAITDPGTKVFFLGSSGSTTVSPPIYFEQSGGVLSNRVTSGTAAIRIGQAGTNLVRYLISGGTILANTVFQIDKPNMFEFAVKGDLPSVNLNVINNYGRSYLHEFILDKTPNHIAPVCFYGTGQLAGELRVKLDGGVLLTATNAFTLFEKKTSSFNTSTHASLPDATLWTVSKAPVVSPTREIATLNGKLAEIAMQEAATFTPTAMGYVSVSGLNKRRTIDWVAWMQIMDPENASQDASGETLAFLQDNLVAAGYTNSVVAQNGIYNLKVAIPAEYMSEGNANFVWDFTDPGRANTLATPTTNALVKAVFVTRDTGPALATLISLR